MTSPWTFAGPPATLSPSSGAALLVDGQTFCVSAAGGDMAPELPHGLFMRDTRVVSRWELRVDGARLEPLADSVEMPFEATFAARSLPAAGRSDADFVVTRHRSVGDGMRERLIVRNYAPAPNKVVVELVCDADFAGLFDVKESRVEPHARPAGQDAGPGRLTFHDPAGTTTTVTVDGGATVEAGKQAGRVTWHVELEPQGSYELVIDVGVTFDDDGSTLGPGDAAAGDESQDSLPEHRYADWLGSMPTVRTGSAALDESLTRTFADLGALRIFDPAHPGRPAVAAGAPWFMTVFGRDSLLTGWMSLIADRDLAHGVLETLARHQGTDVNPATEQEPGRIMHELRSGAAGRSLGGREVYYGAVDATPLFVMLLGELRRWGLGDEAVTDLLPHADAALAWIASFGDRDGDGYVEYERATPAGLVNQGWKDSRGSIGFADGRVANTPIALCEVQGYTYAAYVARAELAAEAGDHDVEARYLEKAQRLKQAFNRDFWLEDRGWYAVGLDAAKRPIDGLASNMGHCLWTGIVDDDKAAAVAEHLLSPEMFSGWGIRTLATSMPAYNPVSYHRGSVWPHDSVLCAAGLMRYGFVDEAQRVVGALLDAALASDGRLPELFSGLSRSELPVPASYPTSCSPQAWSSATPLEIVRLLLRLDPRATRDEIAIAPVLPASIGRLRIEGLDIAGHKVTIDVEGDRCEISGTGSLTVRTEPRGAH